MLALEEGVCMHACAGGRACAPAHFSAPWREIDFLYVTFKAESVQMRRWQVDSAKKEEDKFSF